MKKFAATAIVGAIGAYANQRWDNGRYHQFAIDRVRDTRQHLERVFGHGLLGMFNKHGDVTEKRLERAWRAPLGDKHWMDLGGIKFNSRSAGTSLYGVVNGFQYKGLEKAGPKSAKSNLVESNCFYGVYGLLEAVDQLTYNMKHMVDPAGEVKWFNMIAYDPMTIVNNSAVTYEMCDMYQQIERLSGLFSMDWSLLGSQLGTSIPYFLVGGGAGGGGKVRMQRITKLLKCPALTKILKTATKITKGGAATGWGSDAKKVVKKDLKKIAAKAAGGCKINYYRVGKELGHIMSRIMQQKLQEAKLK